MSQPADPAARSRRSVGALLGAARSAFVAIGAFSVCINLLMLAVPIYMMQLFDRVLATRNLNTLYALTAMVAVALLVMAVLEGVRGRLLTRVSTWLDRQLSVDVLNGAIAVALRGGPASAQGLRDVTQLRQFLGGPSIFPFFDAPWTPILLAIIFMMNPTLGWIATLGALLLFGLAVAGEALTRAPLVDAGARATGALNDADAAVRNADVVAAMGMMPALAARWRRAANGTLTSQTLASDLAGLVTSVAKFARLALQVAMLGAGAWLATEQIITGGAMIAASIIMGRALAPVEQSINAWKALVAARQAYRQIAETVAGPHLVETATSLPRPTGQLDVEGLTFRPEGLNEPILSRVGFALEPGEALGLIGPSAAGKTTLARMLVGSLAPTMGAARLDGIDIAAWDAADRGPHIGYLPQDIELFNGSVRDNIARMGEAGDDEVIAAARLADVHEMIVRLPQGYDTQIGPGGAILSGGQKQRIALARAVFGTPCLIVLDEPNSNLDSTGEQALIETVGRLRGLGATVVMIAHRPGVLAQMDKVLVLRDGAVAQFGTRDEVLAQLNRAAADANAPPRPRAVRSAAATAT